MQRVNGYLLAEELMSMVFLHLPHPIYPENRGTLYEPLQVCRLWRDVALNTAALWDTISIATSDGDFFAMDPAALIDYLSRSKNGDVKIRAKFADSGQSPVGNCHLPGLEFG